MVSINTFFVIVSFSEIDYFFFIFSLWKKWFIKVPKQFYYMRLLKGHGVDKCRGSNRCLMGGGEKELTPVNSLLLYSMG